MRHATPPPPRPAFSSYLTMRRLCAALSLLFITIFVQHIFANAFIAAAQPAVTAADVDDGLPDARVVRISLLRGTVWLQRGGESEWEQATLNFPLVEGDRLATSRDARVEIQFDRDNFARLDQNATLHLVTLRPEGVALSLTEGTLSVRLHRFTNVQSYFEVDAPNTTVAFEKAGLYRLDVDDMSGIRFTVRDDGRARLYSEQDAFTVRHDRTVERRNNGTAEGDWSFTSAVAFDYWDDWASQRDRFIAERRGERATRPYDEDVWGADELDGYGDWIETRDYGRVWRPHRAAISRYADWAPYRYGHWRWRPPYGWTWVGDEDWGWAPYHYGRWVYYDNNWCWTPRFYGYTRARWRPALVVFVILNRPRYGNHIAWYPLDYHQQNPRYYPPRHDGRNAAPSRDSLTPLRREEIARLERTNPARLRAITTIPAGDFGRMTARTRAADRELAREALTAEPVRGRLPVIPANRRTEGMSADATENRRVRPIDGASRGAARGERVTRGDANGDANGATERNGETIVAARPPAAPPTRTIEARPTGAATRERGVALGEQLRRTRLPANREVRASRNADRDAGGNTPGGDPRADTAPDANNRPPDTGIFTRPATPARPRRDDGEERRAREQGERNEPRERGERRTRDNNGDIFTRPLPDTGGDNSEDTRRERRPARPPREERRTPSPDAEPPRERSESRPEPRPERRPERQPEPERRPEPRPEPRAEPRAEPRSEPRPEARPERPAAPPRERVDRKVAPIDLEVK